MQSRRSPIDSPIVKWASFLLLLAVVMVWAVRGVLLRAARMKAADTPASAFYAMTAGTRTSAVVRLQRVAGKDLEGVLLERETDTLYRQPNTNGSTMAAVLTSETSVVMGKAEDIVPGAIVQLAGILDAHHALRTKQVVILTGYVRLLEGSRGEP
jgi:hypothetical protein